MNIFKFTLVVLLITVGLFSFKAPLYAKEIDTGLLSQVVQALQSLEEQIQPLLAQAIALLEAASDSETTAQSAIGLVPNITDNFWTGSSDRTTNGQVTEWQKFLTVHHTGPFAVELGKAIRRGESGYFGDLTGKATKEWQAAQGIEPVYPSVGPQTRDILTRLADVVPSPEPALSPVQAPTSIIMEQPTHTDTPGIAYYNDILNNLEFAKCDKPDCTTGIQFSVIDNDFFGGTGYEFIDQELGRDGNPILAYLHIVSPTITEIRFAHCADTACNSAEVVSLGQIPPNESISLEMGSDGLPIITYLYIDALGGVVRTIHCGNKKCSANNIVSDVDNIHDAYGDVDLAIGSDGLPVIAYGNSTSFYGGDLFVAHCGNFTCTANNNIVQITTANQEADFWASKEIEIGGDGLPVVTYYRYRPVDNAHTFRIIHCGVVDCSSGNERKNIDVFDYEVGAFHSMAIGANGLPVISYFRPREDLNSNEIIVATCTVSSCSSFYISNPLYVVSPYFPQSYKISLAIAGDTFPYITHSVASGDLVAIKCGGPTCRGDYNAAIPIKNGVSLPVNSLFIANSVVFAPLSDAP